MKKTPFDELTWVTLLFLFDCTKDQEPWCGVGIATNVHNEIKAALHRKAVELDFTSSSHFHNDMLENIGAT